MIVAIFVAGESYKGRNNEFPLYQKTFYAQKKKDELIESCPQKNGGGFLGKGSSGTTPPTFVCFKGMDEKSKQDYAVFAVEKNSGLKECTHNLEQNQSKFKADDARAILQSLSALFKTQRPLVCGTYTYQIIRGKYVQRNAALKAANR